MMICIQQPSYIPWIGYFEQILKVDNFIFFDDVQYTNRSWKTRNKIKTQNGLLWLNVPVIGGQNQLIKDVLIDYKQNWINKHLKSILLSYKKCQYFEEIYDILDNILNTKYDKLAELDVNIIKEFAFYLGYKGTFLISSALEVGEEHKEMKVIEICKKLEANKLYNGKKAEEILDITYFNNNDIKITFQDFVHPIYPQLYGEFIPYLSVIDLLFNCGRNSINYIIKSGENSEY